MEYLTTYPKTISFFDGLKGRIHVDGGTGVEQLTIVVKKNVDELLKIFSKEDLLELNLNINNHFRLGMDFH